MKIITTFAKALMMKYIFCILLSILLAGGIKFISTTDHQQAPQTKTGGLTMCTDCTSFVSDSVNVHDIIKRDNFNDSDGNYNFNDGILCNAFLSQCNAPSKTLRFNVTHLVMHVLSALDSPHPDNRWKKYSSDSHFTRFSNGYYIYTLEHILI